MIIDYLAEFTPIDGQTASGDSTYTIDFSQVRPTTGHDTGSPVVVFCLSEEQEADVTVAIKDCDTEEGTYATIADGTIAAGTTILGIPMPFHHQRYVKVSFTGSGTIKAFITSGFQDNIPQEQAPSIETAS